jgi:hypothetical protein
MAKRTYTYDGSEWVGLTSTTADLSNYANMTTTPISGFRNAIINGDFRIWQRGTSTSTERGIAADRWILGLSGATGSISRQSFTPGNTIPDYEPEYFLRLQTTVANDASRFEQRIEDVRTFAGQTVTVSFWAKTDTSRGIQIWLEQIFGTGGSSQVVTNTSPVTTTTSWQRYSFTVNIPSISGKTIGSNSYLALWIGNNSFETFTLDVWGVQVEKGIIPTPFEQRPIGVELSLCQRYFCSSVSNDSNFFHNSYLASPSTGFNEGLSVSYPTRMRIVPTLTVSFVSFDNATNGGQLSTVDGFNQYFRHATGGYPYAGWRATYTANAEI